MNSSYSSVLSNKNFVMLWLAQIFSQISLNILSFVLAIEVYRLTNSNTAVSLMMLTFGVPAIIFGVIFGGVVDYFDKKTVLVFSNLTRAFILVLYFFVSSNIFMLYFLSVVVSIITQLFIPAEVPSISKLVKRQELLLANSLFTTTFYLSTALGSIAAGPLIKLFGSKNTILVMALFMFVAFLMTLKLPKLKLTDDKFKLDILSIMKPIYEGLKFIHQNIRIRQSLFLLTFAQSLIATLAILAPGFANKILLLPVEDVSIYVMGPSVVGLVSGALLVSFFARKFLRGIIILTGIISTGISLVLIALVSLINAHGMIYIVMILLCVLGISNSLINVPSATILQEETDENMRGRIYGVVTSLTGGMSILPVLFSGILADTLGTDKSLLIIGILILAGILIYRIKFKTILLHTK